MGISRPTLDSPVKLAVGSGHMTPENSVHKGIVWLTMSIPYALRYRFAETLRLDSTAWSEKEKVTERLYWW